MATSRRRYTLQLGFTHLQTYLVKGKTQEH